MPQASITRRCVLTPTAVDDEGNPQPVYAPFRYVNSDDTIATLNPSEDGSTCEVIAEPGASGTTTVDVFSDADPGPADDQITGSFDITVGPGGGSGRATRLDLEASEVE